MGFGRRSSRNHLPLATINIVGREQCEKKRNRCEIEREHVMFDLGENRSDFSVGFSQRQRLDL